MGKVLPHYLLNGVVLRRCVCDVRDKNSGQFGLCTVTREFTGQIETYDNALVVAFERLLRIGLKLNSAVEMNFFC